MGDRSNIYFRNGDSGIGIYGHWSGTNMALAAMRVLKNKAFESRIGDPSYATRIGVQTVLEHMGAAASDESGYGLWSSSTGPDDNEYRVIVIDVNDGTVYVTYDWKHPQLPEAANEPTYELLAQLMRNR